MLNINQLVAFALCIKRITTASWVKHNDTSLTWDDASAVGVYNDTIFIIGGYRKTRQVTEYQWTTASYTVKQSDVLNEDIHGTAQFWAQKQHILYLIQPTGDAIATYDMQTEQLTTDVYTIPTDVTSGGCLAATDHHLYVIGGYHYTHLDTVQILDFSTEEWTNGPSMRQTRTGPACITHNDYLWAFGGIRETNERIRMKNISQNAWDYIDSFSHVVDALRCVAWEETIYIIGGQCKNCGGEEFWDTVETVDSVTGTITTLSDAPPYPSAWTSPIIVDGILYVFGGTRSGSWDSEMYYYILPTDNPTKNPTKSPTQTQSNNPSNDPTQRPTKAPSHRPTQTPTFPTRSPSKDPTVKPTALPTTDTEPPTKTPTQSPSKPLTISPTMPPTPAKPSNRPSSAPSPHPSYAPQIHDTRPNVRQTLENTATTWIEGSNTSAENGTIDMLTLVLLSVISVLLLICGVAIYMMFVYTIRDKRKPERAGQVLNVEDTINTQRTQSHKDDACLVINQSIKGEDMETNIIVEHGEGNAAIDTDDDILVGVNTLQGDDLAADDVVGAMHTRGQYNVAEDEFIVVGGEENDVTLAGIEMYGNEPVMTQEGPAGLQPDEFIVDGDNDTHAQTQR
eukprot:126922_1